MLIREEDINEYIFCDIEKTWIGETEKNRGL